MDDYVPENFGMLQADLVRRNVGKVTILRDEDTVDIYIDKSMIGEVLNTPGLFDLAVPFIVDSVMTDSPNAASGIRHGDRIAALDSVATPFVQDSRKYLAQIPGRTVQATVLRGADTLTMDLQVDTTGRIGVFMQLPGVETRKYSLISAIPAGVKFTFSTIGGYLKDLKLVATPRTEAYKSVGSFIAIGQIFPANWDWYRFLQILALLSIMLGVMNLLPIPGLDGGHIVFTVYEMMRTETASTAVAQIIRLLLLF